MNRDVLREVLIDQWDMLVQQKFVRREFSWDPALNYCLVGIRRAGKSYLLYQHIHDLLAEGIAEENILYVNFEDERLLEMTAADLNLLIEVQAEFADNQQVTHIFLDEIQNIAGWEKFVRRLADSKYHVFITGSNAKMLSREIATTLGGRFMICTVYPYTFVEYLQARQIDDSKRSLASTKGRAAIVQAFRTYLQDGGFPELVDVQQKQMYLNSIYQTIYLGDIIARNGISNDFAVRLILKKIAEAVCQPLSFSRLSKILTSAGTAIAKTTVIKYIGYMQDSYLIFSLTNFTGKLVEKETSPKYYFMDTGLLNLLLLDGSTASLENLVAIELVRRYGRENVFYYLHNIEVDFFVPEQKLAIQVCYYLHQSDTTYERETKALVKFNAFMPEQKLLILTNSEEEDITVNGVAMQVLPVWKWLLQQETISAR